MTLIERSIKERLKRTAATEGHDAVVPIAALANTGEHRALKPDVVPEPGTLQIVIDQAALRAAGYLPESSKDRQFAEHYRQIKRPLISRALSGKGSESGVMRAIMMASALPGDGKTFTSINLALSMAREKDISVVLIDADVAKPNISRIFAVDEEPGLLDALVDEQIDINTLILPTTIRGLSILPAGKQHEAATELLASARMDTVVAGMLARNPRRIALFDSPPLLLSSESRALVRVVGQIALVVCSGKTPRQAVLSALGCLGEGKSLGLILNQGEVGITEGYYGYGAYGYGAEVK